MLIAWFLIALTFLVIIYRWARWTSPGNLPRPGGIEGIPFIGALYAMYHHLDDFLDWLLVKTKELGPVWTFAMPGQPRFVIITDPTDVKHILKDNFDNYVKGPEFHERFVELLGDGIFNADADKWRLQRKTAAPLFNVRNFKTHMVGVFVKHGLKLCAKLDEKAQSGEPVDLQELLYRATLDSIGMIGFGVEINALDEPSEFALAFDTAQRATQIRFLTPFWQLRKIYAPAEWTFRRQIPIIEEFAMNIVRERLASVANGDDQSDKHDLLSLFIKKGIEADAPFSERYLRDLLVNFAIAGRDTLANSLSWQLFMLTDHPHVVNKIRAELDDVLAGGDPADYAALKRLTYTAATFKETLRLYPSVPKDAKMAINADTLPSGYTIPAGAWATYLPWVMGRLPQIWGTDCLEFKPERFIDAPEPDAFKYPAFNAGPRTCLGKQMATIEAKVLTALLLQRFDFELAVPRNQITYLTNLTLPMANGLPLIVHKRKF